MNKNIIAIDGPAASGKGTLAKKIAAQLGFAHMDTGLLYRGVAYMVLEARDYAHEAAAAIKAAQKLAEAVASSPSDNILHNANLGGKALDLLKEERVTEAASLVASMPDVRRILLDMQKDFAAKPPAPFKGAVLDGRDIGTVICPEAPVKLFIQADLEVRAERRFKELQSKGIIATYEAVLRDMRERDERDAARAAAPMKAAIDAVTLDTTSLNPEQALDKAMEIVRARLNP